MGALEALNGMLLFGLTTAFSVRPDSEGLAAGKQRGAPGGLEQDSLPWNSRERELSVWFLNRKI
jgi:hypothetical protein